MIKRKIVNIEDMINYRTLVFLVHKENYEHAASVLVSLYNEWTAKNIRYDCGLWMEQRMRDMGISCEFSRKIPWKTFNKEIAV